MNEIIINTSQTRTLEQLEESERKQVEKKLSSLDYMNPISIIQFGSESSKEVTALSADMLSKFKVKDFEAAQELITNLVRNLKTVNPEILLETNKKGGILSRLPGISKRSEQKITQLLTQQISIEKAIDEVEDKLVATKLILMNDMEFCSQMIKKTYEYVNSQEIDYLTIQEALNKATQEKERVEQLFKQNPNNPEYSYKISELNRAINRLELKAHNILVFRTSTLQSIAQIGLVQGGDEIMVSKIDDTIINVIPSWKRHFSIGLQIYRLNNAVTIQKLLDNATNELLLKNSEMLKETLIQTAIEMERPSIDPETLQKVNINLQETFNGLNKVKEDSRKLRIDAMKTIESVQTMALELQSGINTNKLEVKDE